MSGELREAAQLRKVQELASTYQSRGYRTTTNPAEMPEFLRDLRPDLVAVSENDKVVFEVRGHREREPNTNFRGLANVVANQPEWRLELVMVQDLTHTDKAISPENIRHRLDEAEHILPVSPLGAFLVGWTAVEAILRTLLSSEKPSILTPVKAVKNSIAYGLISQSSGDILQNAAQLRNSLIHGFQADESLLTPKTVEALLREATKLLAELSSGQDDLSGAPTVDEMVDWFLQHYEDPAHHVPYDTGEGGYIYYLGGPYEPSEILNDQFPDAPRSVIDSAVHRIHGESNEWIIRGQYP